MTGFGRGEAQDSERQFTVELKSVNHRYNDIVIKMSKRLTYLEEQIKELVKDEIKRGRVEVFITLENIGLTDTKITMNTPLARQYYDSLQEVKNCFPVIDDISVSLISRFPDVLKVESREENEDEIWNCLREATLRALEMLIKMRIREGNKLKQDINHRLEFISSIVENIEKRAPKVVIDYKAKLKERLNEILEDITQVDENRLHMEVVLFADKSNIDEEIVRLRSHIHQLKKSFNERQPIGRKLDFLLQEMNREINTVGSKSSDLDIINYVVEVKSELEKIREQVQNIE